MNYSRHTWTSPPVLAVLALALLAFTVYGSLLPFEYTPRPFADAVAAFRHITLFNPGYLGGRGDWIVSVVLYLFLSFLLMAGLCVDRPRGRSLTLAPAVALFCIALAAVVEFVQLYFPPRTVSVNDLIVEAIGSLTGVVLWLIGGQRIVQWVRRVSTPTGIATIAGRLIPGYLVLLLVVELMPFDFAVRPAELLAKYDENKIWLLPFTLSPRVTAIDFTLKLFVNVTCFFPLGLLPALASQRLGERTRRARWVAVFFLGLGAATLVECLQLLVYSRICDSTDVITGTFAVLLGWRAGQWALGAWRSAMSRSDPFADPFAPTTGARPAILVAVGLAWFVAVLCLNWAPFDFTTDPDRFAGPDDFTVWGIRRMTWLPFVDYYWGSKYLAIDQFIRKSFSFLPLGILCAVASPRLYRPRATLHAVALALAASLIIETGRYFLPTHSASVTDLLLQGTGAWFGFRCAQYVRAIFWAEKALYGYLYTQPEQPPTIYCEVDEEEPFARFTSRGTPPWLQ